MLVNGSGLSAAGALEASDAESDDGAVAAAVDEVLEPELAVVLVCALSAGGGGEMDTVTAGGGC